MNKRPLESHDDRPHEHGGEDGWIEQITIAFSDPAIVGAVRATWEPIERRAEADLLIRLEDGVMVRGSSRTKDVKAREEEVGGFFFSCSEHMSSWRLAVDLQGLMMAADGEGMMGRSVPVTGAFELKAVGAADGFGVRRRIVTAQRFASIISSGAFSQPISMEGELLVGDRRLHLQANGVRSRCWGVPEPDPQDARLFVAFDDKHAAWFDRRVLGDTEVSLAGSIGAIKVPSKLEVQRNGEGQPQKLVLGGLSAEVIGQVPADGPGDERLIVRCRSGSLEALGIAEIAVRDIEDPAAATEAERNLGQPQRDHHAVANRQDAGPESSI